MVDALRRAARMVTASGLIVDVHPLGARVPVQVGDAEVGEVEDHDAPVRHAAADAALPNAVADGLLTLVGAVDFDFYTYGDTIEELRDYIAETWQSGRIDDRTVVRARSVLRSAPVGVRPRLLERVRLTTLRPRATTAAASTRSREA